MHHLRSIFLAILSIVVLSSCANVQPVPYSDIQSSSYWKTNDGPDSTRIPFSYSKNVEWVHYTSIIIEPVKIYVGADNQFNKIDDADKSALASYMDQTFKQKLSPLFRLSNAAGPNTLRLSLTLTGADTNSRVAGTLTRLNLLGGLYDGVQAARGKNAAFSGSVSYTVEIYDAESNKILYTYVTQQYPNALNGASSFTPLGAAKAGIVKGAEMLAEQLKR